MNLPNYKDVRFLLSKDTSSKTYDRVEVSNFEVAWDIYATDSTGQPEMAVVDNDTISLFPPDPDQTWDMRLYHWEFTSVPTDQTSDNHAILRRFPEALIYAAAVQLILASTHDVEQAAPYQSLFDAEFRRLDRYNKDREGDEHTDFVPRTGPNWPKRLRRPRAAYTWT